jgi:hypothetical protein
LIEESGQFLGVAERGKRCQTVFFLLGGIEGRTLAARRALSAVRGFVRRAALGQEPTGGSTTLAHQIQNFFPGETRIDARHVQR